jgi:hypothetical protein
MTHSQWPLGIIMGGGAWDPHCAMSFNFPNILEGE